MRFPAVTFLLLSILAAAAAEQNSVGVDLIDGARREFQSGKLDAALSMLDEAAKQGVEMGRVLDLRGCVLMEQGKLDEAAKLFEEATRAEKPAPLARLHYGDALRRQQKWEEARAQYQTAIKNTDILVLNERLRFATFVTYLGGKDEEHARQAMERIAFPTESAAYYYCQAGWAFAHGSNREAQNWIKRAEDIFPPKSTAWFARHLYDFGWLKTKPPLTAD